MRNGTAYTALMLILAWQFDAAVYGPLAAEHGRFLGVGVPAESVNSAQASPPVSA
ncbi:hypothetical protein GCM10009813_24220 [Brevibacterium marinum]